MSDDKDDKKLDNPVNMIGILSLIITIAIYLLTDIGIFMAILVYIALAISIVILWRLFGNFKD